MSNDIYEIKDNIVEPCPPPPCEIIAIDDDLTFGNYNQLMALPDLPSTLMPLFCDGPHLSTLPDLPLVLHTLYENQPPPTATVLHTPPMGEPFGETPFYRPSYNPSRPIKTPKQKRIEAREQNSKEAKRRREDAGLSKQQLANKYCPHRDWQCGCWREGGC